MQCYNSTATRGRIKYSAKTAQHLAPIYNYTVLLIHLRNLKLGEVVGEGTFGVLHKAIWRGTVVAAKIINIPNGSETSVMKEIEMCR